MDSSAEFSLNYKMFELAVFRRLKDKKSTLFFRNYFENVEEKFTKHNFIYFNVKEDRLVA